MLDHPSPVARLHVVEDAVASLRRGMPVVLAANTLLCLLAVETVEQAGLDAFAGQSAGAPRLLLSSSRAAALTGTQSSAPVAFDPAGLDLETLRALADPTLAPVTAIMPVAEAPQGAEAALALAVIARLLPALLVAPATIGPGVPAADVLNHSLLAAANLVRVSEAPVPLEDVTDARLVAYRAPGSGMEHYAILVGRPETVDAPLVRVHSECFTGDLLGSLRCDCGSQLRGAIRRITEEGAGAILYMGQEGRGIGLPNKLRAYRLQDRGMDTLDANHALGFAGDERDFLSAAAMLRDLGLTRIRLLTNNPDKIAALATAHGIEVAGRISLLFAGNGVNDRYLQTKTKRFGHLP